MSNYSLLCNNWNIPPHHWHWPLTTERQRNYPAESSVDPPNPTQSFQRQQNSIGWSWKLGLHVPAFKRKLCMGNWYSIGVCCCRIQKCTAQVNFTDYLKMASKTWWVLQNKANGSQPKLKKVNEPLYLWTPCSPYSYVHTYQTVHCGAWWHIYLCVNFLSLELCTKYWMIFGIEYKISLVLWRRVGLCWMLL